MSWQVDFQTNNEVADIKYTAGIDATHEKNPQCVYSGHLRDAKLP